MNDIVIKLTVDGKEAFSTLQLTDAELLKFNKAVGNTNLSLKNIATSMGLAFGASEVLSFLKSSVDEVEHQTRALQQLNQVLKTTGGVSGLSAQQLQNMATQMEEFNRFKFDDKVIMDAQGLLLTFTKIGNEAFPRALQLAMDLSVRFNQDLQSSIVQVGKALNDPVKGVTALSRVGVQFTEVQKEMIAKFIQQNDLAGAQRVIMDELTTQVGGAAKEAVTEYGEAVGRLADEWEGLKKSLGGNIVIPALTYLVEQTNTALERWEYTIARLKSFFGGDDPRVGWGVNKNVDQNWIPAVKDQNQGQGKELVLAQKGNDQWTSQNKTVAEVRDKIKELNAELEDTVSGSKEYIRLTNEIAKLEDSISKNRKTNTDEKKKKEEERFDLILKQTDLEVKLAELTNGDVFAARQAGIARINTELSKHNLTLEHEVELREALAKLHEKDKDIEKRRIEWLKDRGNEEKKLLELKKKQKEASENLGRDESKRNAGLISDPIEREKQLAQNAAKEDQAFYKDQYEKGLISKEDYERMKYLIQLEYDKKSRELDQENFVNKITLVGRLVDTLASTYNQLYNSMSENVKNELDDWQDKEQSKIDAERETALKHAKTSAQRDKINEQYDAKEEQLEAEKQKRAEEKLGAWFAFQKAVNIVQATSNTALAATEALTAAPPPWNFALMAAVVAAGMGQIAVITSQEMPGYAKGGLIRVNEEGPEYIMNAQSTKNNIGLLDIINTNRNVDFSSLIAERTRAANNNSVIYNQISDNSLLISEVKSLKQEIKNLAARPIENTVNIDSSKVVSTGLARLKKMKM